MDNFLLCLNRYETPILLITLFVLIYYAWETGGMKRQMIKQKELSIRPFIVLSVEGDHYFLKNIGHGPALKIKMDNINLVEEGDHTFGYCFEEVDILSPNVDKQLGIFLGDDRPLNSLQLAAITPMSAHRAFDFRIRYHSLDNKRYSTSGKLGKGGVTLQKPEQKV